MATISRKAQEMPASAIRKLVPYADAAKKQGIKVDHLNIGQPDIKSPECALKAIRENKLTHISYSHSAGLAELRDGLANRYYKNIGINIDPSELIVTVAGSESVHLALEISCNEGDEVIVLEPFYTNYNTFAFLNGITIKAIQTDIRNGFQVPAIEEFEKAITPKTKAILVCNPGNPTGTLYSRESMLAIGEIARRHDLFLISDEVYREFCYTGAPYISAFHLPGIEEQVVLIDSVSKRYNECGIRIGALITKHPELKKNVMKFCQARLSPPLLGQIVAEGSIDTTPGYMLETYNEYVERRKFLIDQINKIPGCYTPIPMGAFYTVVKLPVDDADRFCQWCLSDFELDGETIFMAPASGFYTTPGMGHDEVRMAYVLKKEDLARAMKVLAAALQAYPGRTI